jgi:predicted component of type VI protein secretion system
MLDSPIFQIALALLFVFLVMAGIVSIVQQFVVEGLRLRARTLRNAIVKLLSDATYKDKIAKRFFRHPMTASLSGGRAQVTCIEPDTFVVALASAVQPEWSTGDAVESLPASVAAMKDGALKERLQLVLPPSGANRAQIEASVKAWYNTATQKMSERFKADCVALSWGVAVIATILLNVSAIEIATRLRADDQLRVAFAALAPELAPAVYERSEAVQAALRAESAEAAAQPDGTQTATANAAASLNARDAGALLTIFECAKGQSDMPVGWPWMASVVEKLGVESGREACADARQAVEGNAALAARLAEFEQRVPAAAASASDESAQDEVEVQPLYGPTFERNGVLEVLLGWLITIVAAAQGAPFWFNAIRRIAGRS